MKKNLKSVLKLNRKTPAFNGHPSFQHHPNQNTPKCEQVSFKQDFPSSHLPYQLGNFLFFIVYLEGFRKNFL